jgi:hypothetical protein
MYPVQRGTSADFWRQACGVDIGTTNPELIGGIYQPHDGWYIYYYQGFHGQYLFRVPHQQAAADFPKVVQELKTLASRSDHSHLVSQAAAILEPLQPLSDRAPDRFLSLLHEQVLGKLRREEDRSLYQYRVSAEQAFDDRWARIRRYWINIAFECVFFAGLGIFTFQPWLRNPGTVLSKSLHLGSFPVLVMLPFYLGYAPFTFSSMGPSDGVLYPWVIWCTHGCPGLETSDQWVFDKIPKLLEPLSQSSGPLLSLSGGAGLGPVTALVLGFGIAVIIVFGSKLRMRT